MELTEWEAEVKAEQQRLMSLQSECQQLGSEVREERGKVERLQGLLHEATSKQVTLQYQKDALQQQMDQVYLPCRRFTIHRDITGGGGGQITSKALS